MNVFRLEALRARYGDALLLHAGTEHRRELILIDGGAARVYEDTLKPRLEELRSQSGRPLDIRLLVVSHIDDDHVNGLLDFTSELIEAGRGEAPLARIREMWHNSFSDDLARGHGSDAVEESAMQVASLAAADRELTERLERQTRLVLESVGQGRRLRGAAERLRISLNPGFEDRLVLRETAPERTPTIGGAELRVVGPGRNEVEKLEKRWREELPKILEKEASRQAKLEAAAKLDRSVFNLSSIVILAASGDRTMLLTGDARGDMILDWLAAADLTGAEGRAHFSLLKLPHHGSDRNVTPAFFEKITADHYLVSGDGRHGNPEPATFDMLFTARGPGGDYTVHMTYGPEELAEHHDFDYQELERVLDRHPGSRDRLRFPFAGEKSIAVDL